MGRKQLYTDDQLKRYVLEYVATLKVPTIITAADVAAHINKNYNFANPLKYWHFTRRPEVVKYIASYNERLEEFVDVKDENFSVLPDYGIDIERILRIKDDEEALRAELAAINRQIMELTNLVHTHQKRVIDLERKLLIVEDRAVTAERKKSVNPEELNAEIKKYKKKAAEIKQYMDRYILAGIKTNLIVEGRLDDEIENPIALPPVMADTEHDDLEDAVEHYAGVMADIEDDDPFVIQDDFVEEQKTTVYSEQVNKLMSDLDDL